MDRPVRNKKAVNYSQFLDLDNDDEDFASSPPVSKKARVETKKERKEKPAKKSKPETESPNNSQGKRLHVGEKIYQRDLEVALALSVQETSVVIESHENTPRNASPVFVPSENQDPETSFSNCSIDSNALGLDEITEGNEESVSRSRRQAASKALTEQRKHLTNDTDDEEEADEFKPDTAVSEDSDSDGSFGGEDEDEEFEVKKSKKAAVSKLQNPTSEKKAKNTAKTRKKSKDSESEASFSDEDEEFDVKKSRKASGIKSAKKNNARKENKAPASKAAAIPSLAPVSIKIKPMPARPAAGSSPTLPKPAVHNKSPPVGMKRPAWTPPASSGAGRSDLGGVTVKSPNQGLRLGLSRLARVKPLHPTPVPH